MEWRTMMMSTGEIMEIDEIFRNQLSELREKSNFLESKMKELKQRAEQSGEYLDKIKKETLVKLCSSIFKSGNLYGK
jgi:hypothetical protein